jgi:UDP-N-acetylmuramoyl-tripeptide--D-alanyl-D-alanine ligase
MMSLLQAQAYLSAARLVGEPATRFSRVHTDTRSLQAGDLFVALRGERFDAHGFLAQARASGAVAALAEHGLAEVGLSGFEVPDTRLALGELAAGWRRSFQIPLIAVTGSNGKTTVTQMIAGILRAWKGDHAFATQGNFNNDIGVPLMLLGLRRSQALHHEVAVLELGMNHPGEIAYLARMAAPTVALVNNAQREHQEFMATVEAVARENGQVIEALPADGTAVFPADEAYTPLWQAMAGTRRTLTFALQEMPGSAAHVWAQAQWQVSEGVAAWRGVVHTPEGDFPLSLAVAGQHNLKNALAATACALAAGCPLSQIELGLAEFAAVKGRSQAKPIQLGGRDGTLIDDSYNANPDSVRAAIEVLASLPGPRWFLLGDMGEVGSQGPQFHAEVGAYAAERGIETLWAVGEAAAHAALAFTRQVHGAPHAYAQRAVHHATTEAARVALQSAQAWPDCASVLVKGSRFMKMETLVQQLQAAATEQGLKGPTHAA